MGCMAKFESLIFYWIKENCSKTAAKRKEYIILLLLKSVVFDHPLGQEKSRQIGPKLPQGPSPRGKKNPLGPSSGKANVAWTLAPMDVHSKANVDWKASIRGLIPVHSHSKRIFHDLLLQCHIHSIFHIPNSAGVAWMWKMLWMWHCRSRSWKMRLEWLCTGMRPLMEAFQSTLALLWPTWRIHDGYM